MMSKLNSGNVLVLGSMLIILGFLMISQSADVAQASTEGVISVAVTYQQGHAFRLNPMLAKRILPSTTSFGGSGDISSGGGGDKPVQPKSPPPKQPSNPKSTNYNEVLPGFTQLPNLLPK
jgi:hypothetical protein